MTTTPNLGLTQYAGTDTMNFLTQYNTDLDKIDTTTGKLSNLTTASKTNLVSATNENVTNIGALASLKTEVKTSTVGAINEVYDTTDNGWISARATLTYASASAPTFVCNTSTDLSTRISVGMKIKLTQTTTKYFFVTAITPTTITLYGGTDYVLANTTISNVYYSIVKLPYGFPMNPDKWSVTKTLTTDVVISPIVQFTYPNILYSDMPIGSWIVNYNCSIITFGASTVDLQTRTTLSTTPNGETNKSFTCAHTAVSTALLMDYSKSNKKTTVTVPTRQYLNVSPLAAQITGLTAVGSVSPITIDFVSAYL